MNLRSWQPGLAALLLATLAACGGGGGSSPSTRSPLPTLSQDTNPTGARLDYRSRDYFAAAPGDNWTYEVRIGGSANGQTATRSVSAGSGSDFLITENSFATSDVTTYRRTPEGLLAVAPLAGVVPASVNLFIGNLLEYAEPFYAVGSTRRIVRQGSWGEDLDGDGVAESYRLEVAQVLVGFESLVLPSGTLADVAHFRNVTSLTLQPSDLKQPAFTVIGTEDAWWAPGIGLVRSDLAIVDGTGQPIDTAYSQVLTGGTVGGRVLFAPAPDGAVSKIALVHNALVFDAARQRYYASVPGSVAGNGNRIASIDAVKGVLSYPTGAVGSEPSALALSADGSALYVALDGSGEVLKLNLPGFTEAWRVRLPADTFFGQLLAERLAASPASDVVAVSLVRPGVSPRHGGVALIRGGVLQPRRTQEHTGSNLITFDGDGSFLYGFNNETSEFGLRRIAVLADGLQEQQVVPAAGNYGSRMLDWSPQGLVLDRSRYSTPDLALLGQVNVAGSGCRATAAPNRLVCPGSASYSLGDGKLAVVDAASFVILATPYYERGAISDILSDIVPGAAGQVALRLNANYWNSPATAVWLFTSTALP
jgi:DNA-binding beta-propeller fold protein YncE